MMVITESSQFVNQELTARQQTYANDGDARHIQKPYRTKCWQRSRRLTEMPATSSWCLQFGTGPYCSFANSIRCDFQAIEPVVQVLCNHIRECFVHAASPIHQNPHHSWLTGPCSGPQLPFVRAASIPLQERFAALPGTLSHNQYPTSELSCEQFSSGMVFPGLPMLGVMAVQGPPRYDSLIAFCCVVPR